MIAVAVPSRGRPDNIAALHEAFHATEAEADLYVYVDDDDPALPDYLGLRLPGSAIRIGPRLRLGPTLNVAALALAKGYEVVGFMGDDHRPRTLGWDRRIESVLEQLGTGIAYGNDLIQGANLPTAAFLTSDIITTLGYMAPPGLVHLFLDDFWKRLGEEIGASAYLPDVVIEHCHPIAGAVEWDDGYREVNAQAVWDADEATFARYVDTQLAQDVAKVGACRG